VQIPFLTPPLSREEIEAAVAVLEGTELSYGEETIKFEEEFAAKMDVQFALAVSNGTAALELALHALRRCGHLQNGAKVAMPSFTFAAVANSVVNAGCTPCTPCFVDIEPDTYNLDPDRLAQCKDLQAVIVTHTFGQACNMGPIVDFCADHDLILIEDCAEACGAKVGARRVGSFGDIATYSFNVTKNLTTGEGGMVVTNSLRLFSEASLLRSHGIESRDYRRDVFCPGHNYRLPAAQCAIGRVQLRKLDANNELRAGHAKFLNYLLRDLDVALPIAHFGHVYQLYTLQIVPNHDALPGGHQSAAEVREVILQQIRSLGVDARVYFTPPIHLTSYYKNPLNRLPFTEFVADRVISLPMRPSLTDAEIEFMGGVLHEVMA